MAVRRQKSARFFFDASRLARNGRRRRAGAVWRRSRRVIDLDGVYDPCRPTSGCCGMKAASANSVGRSSRATLYDRAAGPYRGELRISVPVGNHGTREVGLRFDPDARLQEAIRLIFERVLKLGGARQVLLAGS